jgi:cytoskeletal protein RodZ
MVKGSFGEILKRERELREVTLNEVTVATRIPPRFLEAFEREEWEKLPGGVFNRGFVRAIARYLGLNEESLLSEYDLAYGEQQPLALPSAEDRIPSTPKWILVVAVLAILLAAAGVIASGRYGWRRYSAHRAAKRAALAAGNAGSPPAGGLSSSTPDPPEESSPASLTGPASSPANRGTAELLDLAVSTAAATRVRVVADNRVVLDARLPAGETRHLSARNQFTVSAPRPSVVLLELNGQAMPWHGSGSASGTMVLSQKDLRQAPNGNAQP